MEGGGDGTTMVVEARRVLWKEDPTGGDLEGAV